MNENNKNGAILNVYPDSISQKLSGSVALLERPEFADAFSCIYCLPTFFHSDLDRGFSIIDYDVNEELVEETDLERLKSLDVALKFDLVLNHLSVASPQFLDLIEKGQESEYKDFFIDWNVFWEGHGDEGDEGYIVPKQEYLDKLFMRKPGFPILRIPFPDGKDRFYWNTFYQEVSYNNVSQEDLKDFPLSTQEQSALVALVNSAFAEGREPAASELKPFEAALPLLPQLFRQKKKYLGQMDVDARSEKVWQFYEETFQKLQSYGAKIVRLDAFAYLHKEAGMTNFFNEPGTWEYLERLRVLGEKYSLQLLPEIHSEYGSGMHHELSKRGYLVYDFFFPGLVIDALDRGTSAHLITWIKELVEDDVKTINMLGCHDGIPILDLKGNDSKELLSTEQIDASVERILERGGRVKNLYGPDGKKIAYYQVNATFFSALGEDEKKLIMARAIQMFMPGRPQVWYLDIFAGTNNYKAADLGGTGGHKEINRTSITEKDISDGLEKSVVLEQIKLLKLRNTHPAFNGSLELGAGKGHELIMTWAHGEHKLTLHANLQDHSFEIVE